MKIKYLSMAEAAKISPYEQGYLSLLARRGELRAEKNGRNWYTTIDWLNQYMMKKKPHNKPIKESFFDEKKEAKEEKFIKIVLIWIFLTSAIIIAGFLVFSGIYNRVKKIENQTNQFVPEEIIKIPDDQGNFDIYSKGTIKIGKQKQELK
jgi:hypothetical protein